MRCRSCRGITGSRSQRHKRPLTTKMMKKSQLLKLMVNSVGHSNHKIWEIFKTDVKILARAECCGNYRYGLEELLCIAP